MERYLAFDFGLKKIGIASGQSITKTASELTTILNTPKGPDWKVLLNLIQQWKPKALIVGLPLNMDGTPSDMSKAAEAFAKALEKRTSLLVHLVDERLSTREAREQLVQNKSRRYAYNTVDAYAAKLILESWLSG